jgi:hypothetical protein
MSKHVRLILFAVIMVSIFAGGAFAQSTTTGAIGGVVMDQGNAVVPGATVVVKNSGTNKEDTVITDDVGRFRVVLLQPGTYSVTVNMPGFALYERGQVVVEVGTVSNITAVLAVAGVTETTEVVSESPVLNTSQQDFSTNINQVSINELPINGRRWSNFALLAPATTPDGTFGLISFRGISGLLNNNTIDGGDNNQAFFAEERGRTRISYVISQAAIREFQVNTSNYSAEYGRAAGGVTNAVTKSGTNDLHGDLFYYQRNNKWGARNPLVTRQQLVNGVFSPVGFKPEDVRHQFGGAVGGPIVKDKVFFFFSYDQQRRNFPGVPIFSQSDFLNRADRALLTTPVGQTLTGTGRTGSLSTGKGLSNAQVDTAVNFLASLTDTVPRRGDQILILPKIDWTISNKHTLTTTYNRLRWDSPAGVQTQATNTRASDNFGDDFVDVDSLTVRLQSSFTTRTLNEFRFQWGRDLEYQFSQPPLPGEPTTAPGGRSPQVFLTNGFSFGMPEFLERPKYPNEIRWQYADTFMISHGNHTIKFGGDVNRVSDGIDNLRFMGGEYSYSGGVNAAGFYGGLNDFILDYTNFRTPLPSTTPCYSSTRTVGRCYGGNFNQGLGVTGLTFKTHDLNFFAQDDWRATRRMTVNLGLRWEYQDNPEAININPALPQTGNFVDDGNNFGPRIGIAYALTGDNKTSLRGGYGIYYGRLINSTIYNALINTGVGIDRAQRQVTVTATNALAPVFPNLLSSGTLVTPAVQYFSADFQNPLIHQYDVIVEREIATNTVVSVSFLGSLGRNLPTFVDTNLNQPTTTRTFTVSDGPLSGQSAAIPIFPTTRPNASYAQITEIRSTIDSNYKALVLQANRRFTRGLQFQTSYTFSRSIDTGQTSQTFTANNVPYNVFDLSSEEGRSNFDSPHKYVFSAVWMPKIGDQHSRAARVVLNGFNLAPVFYAYSGRPYSGFLSVSGASGAGGVNQSGGANRMPLVPRNSFRQPRIVNFDMRVSRRFSITEGKTLEFLAEGFNVFNRTHVTGVNTTYYSMNYTTGLFTYNTPFGNITEAGATLFRERQVQLSIRFQF